MDAHAPAGSDGPNPVRIFEMLNAFQQSEALRGAIELDLFTALAEGCRTSDALAARCGADPRGLRILCDFLVVHGLLEKSGDEWRPGPTAAAFLDRRQPSYLGTLTKFLHSRDLVEAFRDTAGIVRRGGTLLEDLGTTTTEYEGWVEFARSMAPLMAPAAAHLGATAARLRPGPAKVLDVAAGHGLFGIRTAEANPQAEITALDWAPVLAVASENAARAGVAERYRLLPGDAFAVDFGTGYDVVLLTNFLHHFDRAKCVGLMRKIASCLKDDGCVLTLEFVPDADRTTPPVPAAFALVMLATTPAGDAYTFAEYESMWREAGLSRSTLEPVPRSPQQLVVTRK